MKKLCFGLMLLATLAAPQAALAASDTTIGVGGGAVAGALVAGPVGAVVGAVVGGFMGANSDRVRPRRARRVRAVRPGRQAGIARDTSRTGARRTEAPRAAAEPVTTATVAKPATTWQNPR